MYSITKNGLDATHLCVIDKKTKQFLLKKMV